MEVATMGTHFFPSTTTTARVRPSSNSSRTSVPSRALTSSSPGVSFSTDFASPHGGVTVAGGFPFSASSPRSRDKRSVATNFRLIPLPGDKDKKSPRDRDRSRDRESNDVPAPPDLASYLLQERIVYLGLVLVQPIIELIVAQFLHLHCLDDKDPIYFYINSPGTTKGNRKGADEREALAIYDVMNLLSAPVCTLCFGNAWSEAALLLAAGAKGNRFALPSSTIMIKEPMAQFQGQVSKVEMLRKDIKTVKETMVKYFAKHTGRSPEQITADIRRPKYFSPSEAVEYGIIDSVLDTQRMRTNREAAAKEDGLLF